MYQQYLSQAVRTLQNLDSEELKELLNDDQKLDERVNQAVQNLESEKDLILGQNRSLAEANLGLEPKLIEMRSRVQDLTDEGQIVCTTVKEKADTFKSKSSDTNPETVLALLQTAAAESEDESEKVVKQFLDNELPIDAYLEQFMASRKIMHSRKLKAEKMTELIRNQANAISPPGPMMNFSGPASMGANPNMSPYPPVRNSAFYPPPPGAPGGPTLPYSLGPVSMPQMPMHMFRAPQF